MQNIPASAGPFAPLMLLPTLVDCGGDPDPDPVAEPEVVADPLLATDSFVIRYISPEASDDTKIRPRESMAMPTGRKQLSGHCELS